MPRNLTFICLLAGLFGCSAHPNLDAATSAQARVAPYPMLAPINTVLGAAETLTTADPPRELAEVAARAARLRQRAAILRGAVVDDATRARLAAAVARQAS